MASKNSNQLLYLKTFPQKLWYLINLFNETSITWTENGDTILVDPIKFSLKFIQNKNHFFKYSNYNSFVRQLNLYGFRKLSKRLKIDQFQEYQHKYFIRGRQDLLMQVKRKYFENQNLIPATSKLGSVAVKKKPFALSNQSNQAKSYKTSKIISPKNNKWVSNRTKKGLKRKLEPLNCFKTSHTKHIQNFNHNESQILDSNAKSLAQAQTSDQTFSNHDFIFKNFEPFTTNMTTIINQSHDDSSVKEKISDKDSQDSYIYFGLSPCDNFYISGSELFRSYSTLDSIHLTFSEDSNLVSNHVLTLTNPEPFENNSDDEPGSLLKEDNCDLETEVINDDFFFSQYDINFTNSNFNNHL